MRRVWAGLGALLLLAAGQSGCSGGPGPLVVYAAASLTDVLPVITARFAAEHDVEVVHSFGASSTLAQQVAQGSPGDLLVSASEPAVQRLRSSGLAEEPVVVASNTLQLVVPAADPGRVRGLGDLAREELRVVLCDPGVPCGAAAEQVLTAAGVSARPDSLEADVRAVLTKVATGEADAGLVYRTDVLAAGEAVRGTDVPGADAAANRYPALVLTSGSRTEEARELLTYLQGDEARQLLTEAGFRAP